jgi:hypothetical protein
MAGALSLIGLVAYSLVSRAHPVGIGPLSIHLAIQFAENIFNLATTLNEPLITFQASRLFALS